MARSNRRQWDSPPRSSAVRTASAGQVSTGSSGSAVTLRKARGTSGLHHGCGDLTADAGHCRPVVPARVEVLVVVELAGHGHIGRAGLGQLAGDLGRDPVSVVVLVGVV